MTAFHVFMLTPQLMHVAQLRKPGILRLCQLLTTTEI